MSRSLSRWALAISIAAPLFADTIVLSSGDDDVGSLGYTAGNNPGISFVGTDTSIPSYGTSWVSYWEFNLPSTGPITSAVFDLKPKVYFGDGSSLTVNFTAFALSPALLGVAYAPGNATGLTVYNALNSGTGYGLLTVQPSDVLLDCGVSPCVSQPGNTLFAQLNSAALADINADLGGVFVIGAYLSPSSANPTDDAVGIQFGLLGATGTISQLDLTSAPEPGTLGLGIVGLGLALAKNARRRRPG